MNEWIKNEHFCSSGIITFNNFEENISLHFFYFRFCFWEMKSARGSAVLYILFWQMCCRSVGIKKGQYPDESILTLILTWPIKAEQITHWSISPDMCFFQHASHQSSSYPNQLPVYKYYISIRPVGSAVPTVWVAFVLSMTLLYMLGC